MPLIHENIAFHSVAELGSPNARAIDGRAILTNLARNGCVGQKVMKPILRALPVSPVSPNNLK